LELMDATRSRRSIRSYLPRTVEDENLLAILEAVRITPSAANMQD
jgi:nitroreductase